MPDQERDQRSFVSGNLEDDELEKPSFLRRLTKRRRDSSSDDSSDEDSGQPAGYDDDGFFVLDERDSSKDSEKD